MVYYWNDKPMVIAVEKTQTIKEFSAEHESIKRTKQINMNKRAGTIDGFLVRWEKNY